MPQMDPTTKMKDCSVCRETLKASEHFFRAKAMKDGYASRCKRCWGVRASSDAPEPQQPSYAGYRHPAALSAETHTLAELRQLEKETGLPCAGLALVGGAFVPVMTTRDVGWLDR